MIAVLVAPLLLPGPAEAEPARSPSPRGTGLKVTLTAGRAVFQPGQEVFFWATVTNVGTHGLHVPQNAGRTGSWRLALYDADDLDVMLGRPPLPFWHGELIPEPPDLVWLPPGKSLRGKMVVDLSAPEIPSRPPPGRYQAQLIVENRHRPSDARPALRGSVRSPRVRVVVR